MVRRALALFLVLLSTFSFADEVANRRASAGLRLFRALLAADMGLAQKTVAPDEILILFVYVDDRQRATDLAQRFIEEAKERDKLHGLSIVTEVTNDPDFIAYRTRVPAGVFIAEAPGRGTLASIVRYGIQEHVIVYSPFEGHVEEGVLGGLSVEAQVRPYLNGETLMASHISLKSFFLSVAKVYR
jgi:hypothetical protein